MFRGTICDVDKGDVMLCLCHFERLGSHISSSIYWGRSKCCTESHNQCVPYFYYFYVVTLEYNGE